MQYFGTFDEKKSYEPNPNVKEQKSAKARLAIAALPTDEQAIARQYSIKLMSAIQGLAQAEAFRKIKELPAETKARAENYMKKGISPCTALLLAPSGRDDIANTIVQYQQRSQNKPEFIN